MPTSTMAMGVAPIPARVTVTYAARMTPITLSWQTACQTSQTRTWTTRAILPIKLGEAAACAQTRTYRGTPVAGLHLQSETAVIDIVNLRAQQRREDGDLFGL